MLLHINLPHNIHNTLSYCRSIYREIPIQVHTQNAIEHGAPRTAKEHIGHLSELHAAVEAVVARGNGFSADQGLLHIATLRDNGFIV